MKKIDELGRIVIPKEIRDKLDIKTGDAFNIYTEDGFIVLEPSNRKCFSCGAYDNIAQCGNVTLCIDCAKRISENIKVMFDEDN